MKNIKLLRGQACKVSDADFHWLSEFRWYLGSGYAYTSLDGRPVAMHVMIMKTPKGKHTDHINHDKLDNQRENLRVVSPRKNILHRRPYKGESNPFFGKTHTEEYKKEVSKRFSKKVIQLTISGDFVCEYPSALEAERRTGISNGSISSVCSGLTKTAGGYKWKRPKNRS